MVIIILHHLRRHKYTHERTENIQGKENPNKHSIIIKISKWCKYTDSVCSVRARTTIIILNNVAVFRHQDVSICDVYRGFEAYTKSGSLFDLTKMFERRWFSKEKALSESELDSTKIYDEILFLRAATHTDNGKKKYWLPACRRIFMCACV